MESSPGSQGAGHLRGAKAPFCTRCSLLNLQGAILFVILSTHSQSVGAIRDRSLTNPGTIGPWVETFKTERHCVDFHLENASALFFYWPEDDSDAHFDYCCSFEEKNLKIYTHGDFGPSLRLGLYYDLGLLDMCLPYWRCNKLFDTNTKAITYYTTNTYHTYCEVNDLRKLFKRRFLVDTVLRHGLLESAIPFIISSEILTVISVALYWCIRGQRADGSKVMKAWFRYSRKTIFKDWTHLCLLAIVGNGLIEAVGRQNPYASQSKSFYNYAQLYVVLSILVWYSSVLLQVTYWIAEMELELAAAAKSRAASAAHSHQDTQNTNLAEGQNLSSRRRGIPELEVIFELNDDWKWQPIAAQTGILFCLWGFLTYSVDKDDETTGSVFGLIVSAACPWSGLYASKIIVRASPWLLRRLYPRQILRKPPHSWIWRSRLRLNRWVRKHQGKHHPARARSDLARQDDSGTLPPELQALNEP